MGMAVVVLEIFDPFK
ncbi:Protein of unknown function [Bacillus wiedmannii]|nr:Protein of unknown function [Bacillus wiedmannii]